MKGRWSDSEVALLQSMYPDCHTEDVALWVGRTVKQVYMATFSRGIRKSPDYLASDCAARIKHGQVSEAMKATRFRAGFIPWNKGVPNSTGFSSTRFKVGSKPQTWVPVGSYRTNKDGYLQRKVTDTGYGPRDWQSAHSLIWQEKNGPVPAGCVVVFRPGKRTTDIEAITADDVECLTRGELMRRNSVHTNYPPEVARLVQLRGALNRQINKHAQGTA